MNKMLVWFHSLPDEAENITDEQWCEQAAVSVFQAADKHQNARKCFSGNVNELAEFIAQQQAFGEAEIILPAKNVLYTRLSVPSRSRKRIMQAIPFILEDNLIEDIDKQFLALGDISNGQCQIAIVSRRHINNIYQQIKTLGISVTGLTSEIFLLPWAEGTWSMTLFQDEILVRTGKESGIYFAKNNLDFVFRHLLNPIDEDTEISIPDSLVIYTIKDNELVRQVTAIAEEFDINCEYKKGNILQFALSGANEKNLNETPENNYGINLLQGEFHPGSMNEIQIPFVKTMAAVFLLWFGSQIAFMTYQWHSYKNELQTVETQLQSLYFKTFPESKRLIDVRAQTESKLQQLQKNASANDSFLSLLGLVGQELRKNKLIKIKNLRYIDGILQMELHSKGFVLNQFKMTLQEKHGFLVEEKSSSKVKDEVHTVINFRLNS